MNNRSTGDLVRSRGLEKIAGPTEAELEAIEADQELLVLELALVDAEVAWFASPGAETAADYLEALAAVQDAQVAAAIALTDREVA